MASLENRPFPSNDIARPVFMNHYYAGESLVPVTSKKLIRLDECDTSTENSMRNPQLQGINHESVETSCSSLRIPISTNRNFRMTVPPDSGHRQNRGFHSEFVEPLQNSLGNLNVGQSPVQAVEHVDMQQVHLI